MNSIPREEIKVIYCAGEQGRIVLDILRRSGEEERIVFLDDDVSYEGEVIDGIPVLGSGEMLTDFNSDLVRCIVAFGDEQTTRVELGNQVREAGVELFSVIDPDATLSTTVTLGEGVIVNALTYVGPGVCLKDLVLLDSLVNVSHDVCLRRGVTVGPNATIAGGVTVGTDAYIGAGATVLDDRTIGEGAFIGAGAVVTDDVPPKTTVVGVPARPLSKGQEGTDGDAT